MNDPLSFLSAQTVSIGCVLLQCFAEGSSFVVVAHDAV